MKKLETIDPAAIAAEISEAIEHALSMQRGAELARAHAEEQRRDASKMETARDVAWDRVSKLLGAARGIDDRASRELLTDIFRYGHIVKSEAAE